MIHRFLCKCWYTSSSGKWFMIILLPDVETNLWLLLSDAILGNFFGSELKTRLILGGRMKHELHSPMKERGTPVISDDTPNDMTAALPSPIFWFTPMTRYTFPFLWYLFLFYMKLTDSDVTLLLGIFKWSLEPLIDNKMQQYLSTFMYCVTFLFFQLRNMA